MSAGKRPGRWIIEPPEVNNATVKLFCFPPAGGGAATFRQWPASLPPSIAVYRIQPPGRETRFYENLLLSMGDYEDALLADLLHCVDGPFAFFGHSMGSLVAYRVARRLWHEHQIAPEHLFVSAFRSPQARPPKEIHELPDANFLRELRETYDGIPEQLLDEPEVLDLMLPIVRADLTVVASHSYEPRPPLPCPITAFGGSDDRWIDETQLGEWAVQTAAEFRLRLFPGNHYYLNSARENLLGELRSTLLHRRSA